MFIQRSEPSAKQRAHKVTIIKWGEFVPLGVQISY